MTTMKKTFCVLLTLVMLLCTACGGNAQQNTQSEDEAPAPSGLYYEISGIDPAATAVTVDGNEISAEMYLYWTCFTASNLEYQINMLNSYYGMGAEYLNEEGKLKWDAPFTETVTLNDYATEQAKATAVSYASLENLAKEQGVELTEDDRMAIAAQRAAAADELGGTEAFEAHLAKLGISSETFDKVAGYEHLIHHLTDLVLDKTSPLYLEDADCDQYATYADHILIATIDLATRESLSEDEVAEKAALAEDILAQLQAVEGEEMLQLFDQLANTYSEDTGRATNPTGYIYTPGTMVTEFEDAASALKPGEISGLVESTYGYHIILRRDLAEGLAANPEQKASMAETHLQNMLAMKAQNAEVTYSDVLEGFDHGAFYDAYMAAVEAQEAAAGAAEGESAETAEESK